MIADDSKQYCWLEAISLFHQLRSGDYDTAQRLLDTATEPQLIVQYVLRMLVVFFRGEEAEKLDRFVDAAYRAGPPALRPPIAGES